MNKFLIYTAILAFLSISLGQDSNEDDTYPEIDIDELLKSLNQTSPEAIIADNGYDRVYAVSTYQQVNWYAANEICGSYGMNLATINNSNEHAKLVLFLVQNRIRFDVGLWLGASDLSSRGTWKWISSGVPVNQNYWEVARPSNRNHCMSLTASTKWVDEDCQNKRSYFVCENRCATSSGAGGTITVRRL